MNPPVPPFDPMGLPLPSPILSAFAYLTLTLHFVAMQFTVGAAPLLLLSSRKQPAMLKPVSGGMAPRLLLSRDVRDPAAAVRPGHLRAVLLQLVGAHRRLLDQRHPARHHRVRRGLLAQALTRHAAELPARADRSHRSGVAHACPEGQGRHHYQPDPGGGALNYGEPTRLGRYGFALTLVAGLVFLIVMTKQTVRGMVAALEASPEPTP